MVSDSKGEGNVTTLAVLDMAAGTGGFKYQTQSSVHVGVGRAITWVAVVKYLFTPVQATNFIHVLGKVLRKFWIEVIVVFAGHHWIF